MRRECAPMKKNASNAPSETEFQDTGSSKFWLLAENRLTFGNLSSEQVMRKGRMGDAYVKAKRLTPDDVKMIVDLQNRLNIRFGDAAVRLGLLTEEEVRQALNTQFDYGAFPSSNTSGISKTLDILHAPGSEAAEAVKRLRTELLNLLEGQKNIAIAVLSPASGEGKSHVAASLAIAFAQLNIKTMLIDANLRTPTQHILFDLPNQTGLSTILAKRSESSLQAIPEVTSNFWILGSGPPPPNPVEILSASKLKNLIDSLSGQIRVFIVDTPSSRQWADAQIIAGQIGFALFVAREDITKLAELKLAKHEIESQGVNVLGVVYNKPPHDATPVRTGLTAAFQRFSHRIRALFSRKQEGLF